MKICYSKHPLNIRSNGNCLELDINKDIDIDDARRKFNDAVGQLASKFEPCEYSLSRICERNTLVNDLFLDFCYIKLIEKMSSNYPNIEVSTNKYTIYRYFINLKSTQAAPGSILLFQLSVFFVFCAQGLRVIKFFFEKLIFHRNVRKTHNCSNKTCLNLNNTTIIQTWVADNNFSDKGFHDSYYHGLHEYLKNNNRKCVTWPIFYNVKNAKRAIQYMRKNNDRFLLPEDYLKYSDYLIPIKHFLSIRKMRIKKFVVDGRDLSDLFRFYSHMELPIYASVAHKFIQRLAHERFEDVIVILNHENMVTEKAVLLARNEFYPDLKVWGYFHTTKPRNQLCLEYATYEEYKIVPKPDKIIFNSPQFCEYYSQRYPELICHDGYAFKQAYINEMYVTPGEDSKVLVFLSGNMADSLLIIDLLNLIADKVTDLHFIFRFHPMNIFELDDLCTLRNFSISQEPLPELYSKVKKVVCPYSACLIEASLAGKDVAFIYNPQYLLINPFDDTGIDNYELITKSNKLLNFLRRESNCSSVSNIFNTDPKTLSAFLPEET